MKTKYSLFFLLTLIPLNFLPAYIFHDDFSSGDWRKPQAGGPDYWSQVFLAGSQSTISETGNGLRMEAWSGGNGVAPQITVGGALQQEFNFFNTPLTIEFTDVALSSGGASPGPSSVVSYLVVTNQHGRVHQQLNQAIYIKHQRSGNMISIARNSGGSETVLASMTATSAVFERITMNLDDTNFNVNLWVEGNETPLTLSGAHGLNETSWGVDGALLQFAARLDNANLDRSTILEIGSVTVIPEPLKRTR